MNPERIRAAIRLLYPDEMTPTARNVLENILDDEELEAPVSAGASLYPKEDDMSAKVSRIASRKFQAWCAECADGLNSSIRAEANEWALTHNSSKHKSRWI